MTAVLSRDADTNSDAGELTMNVVDRQDLADGIVGIVLEPTDDADLPTWEPGAHVDVTIDDGERFVRNYSLCGDPADRRQYRIAILRSVDGRGGSQAVHRTLWTGSTVKVSPPRNLFEFRPDIGKPVFFIAGGIGITPILSMVREARDKDMDWHAVYLGRNPSVMALSDELVTFCGERQQVRIHHSDVSGFIDLEDLTATFPAGTQVYACGPEPLLSALTELHERSSDWSLRLERFTAPVGEAVDTAFEVVVDSTGASYQIKPGCSILSVLQENGFDVDFSCAAGVCGTCETAVVRGEPEHRDVVLTDEERESNETMMICVSRAKTACIVLDI